MTYEGKNNYIFISYSHKDAPVVSRYINLLSDNGFRVWYDAGIEAGTEWPEYIEEHLKGAASVLVFMTPNTIESKNCRNEINLALDLEKDILVVYLEDTELIKGMRLQLNSTQSLFRKNHSTEESFMRELVNARILQWCRAGGKQEENSDFKGAEINNAYATRIAIVNAIGTNDLNDLWPTGKYAQTFNRDEFSVVCFHMKLLKPFGFAGTIHNRYQVFDDNNNPLYDDISVLEVEADYDRVSFGWIIRGDDGSVVPEGKYRFVCSVNNSPENTFYFNVTSNEQLNKTSGKGSFFTKLKKIFEN